jgi:hypothetical protein
VNCKIPHRKLTIPQKNLSFVLLGVEFV